jgi:hypothetical protein
MTLPQRPRRSVSGRRDVPLSRLPRRKGTIWCMLAMLCQYLLWLALPRRCDVRLTTPSQRCLFKGTNLETLPCVCDRRCTHVGLALACCHMLALLCVCDRRCIHRLCDCDAGEDVPMQADVICVCVCVLSHWALAAIVEVPYFPSLKCSSHWSLGLFPASVASCCCSVCDCCARLMSTRPWVIAMALPNTSTSRTSSHTTSHLICTYTRSTPPYLTPCRALC